MKNLGLLSAVFVVLFVNSAFAAAQDIETDKLLVRTAVCVKGLLARGHNLDSIVSVKAGEMNSVPPRDCITVITEKKENTECPNDPQVGRYFYKGSLACVNRETGLIDFTGRLSSECDHPTSDQMSVRTEDGVFWVR